MHMCLFLIRIDPATYFGALFCMFLGLMIPKAQAQEELHFEHISVEKGLSNSFITHIYQDKFGYMWFATRHGLNRFDGFNFKIFRYDPHDSLSISSNLIYQIYEDNNEDLWLSLGIGGLCKFDRARETFSYYAYDKASPLHPNNYIVDVISRHPEHTWVATLDGLNYVDEINKTFTLVCPIEKGTFGEPIYRINQLMLDQKMRFWVATDQGVFRYDSQTNIITKCELKVGFEKHIFKENANFVFEDRSGKVWLGGSKNLYYWDNKLKVFVQFKETLVDISIRTMFEDAFGRIWIGSALQGLFFRENPESDFIPVSAMLDMPMEIYHAFADANGGIWTMDNDYNLFYLAPGTFKARQMELDPSDLQNYELSSITTHYSSPDGAVWLGTNGAGIFKLNPGRHKFRHYRSLGKPQQIEPDNYITAIGEDHDGFIWLGTRSGLQRFDPKNRSFMVWEYTLEGDYGHRFNHISTLMVDHLDHLWVATPNGITIFDPDRETQRAFPLYESENSLQPYSEIYQIYEDSKHNIWICTAEGLIWWNRSEQRLKGFNGNREANNSFGSNIFYCILEDKKGDYWIGNRLGGLSRMRFMDEQPEIQNFFFEDAYRPWLKARTVNTIYEDRASNLWVGTYSQGLLKVDTIKHQLIGIKKKGDVPIPNIGAILEDEAGKLWICSNDGLFKYDPETNTAKQFDFNDGLQSNQFNFHAALKSKSGQMYVGGVNGFNSFDPLSVRLARKISPPILTGMSIRGKNAIMERPLHQLEQVDLQSNENFFSLEFISLNYRYSRPNQYAYKLEGIDPDWVYAGTQRSATYTNVPSGTYAFYVKAATGDGYWNDEPTHLKIHIHKPFWQMSWFYILFVVVMIAFIGLIQHLRLSAQLHSIREVEEIRQKAMEDFHDEMGHRLTRISLLAEILSSPRGENKREYLETIKTSAHRLHESMRDFLWALDPRKDSLFELALMLKDFGDELYDKTGIDFRVEGIHSGLDDFALDMDWKRHLSLIFKEAMNNVLKHAKASSVLLSFLVDGKYLEVTLVDNGRGFVPDAQEAGYGLGNMHKRARKLGGQLCLESEAECGSKIVFRNQLPQNL